MLFKIFNKKDFDWLFAKLGYVPKVNETANTTNTIKIVEEKYNTVVVKARVEESTLQRYAIIDPNYTETQIKNQLAIDLMEQIMVSNFIEYKQVNEFNHKFIEATLLISVKK
jgi:hypothetical protein